MSNYGLESQVIKWQRSVKDGSYTRRESLILGNDVYPNFAIHTSGELQLEYIMYKGEKFKKTSSNTNAVDYAVEMTYMTFPEKKGIIGYRGINKITNTSIYRALYGAKEIFKKHNIYPVIYIIKNLKTNTYDAILPRQTVSKVKYGKVNPEYIANHIFTLRDYALVAEIHFNRKKIPKIAEDIPNRLFLILNIEDDNIDNIITYMPKLGIVDSSNFIDLAKNYTIKEPTKHMSNCIDSMLMEFDNIPPVYYPNSKEERERIKKLEENKDYFNFIHYAYRVDLGKLQPEEIEFFIEKKENPDIIAAYNSYKIKFKDMLENSSFPIHEKPTLLDKSRENYLEEPKNLEDDFFNLEKTPADDILEERIEAVRKNLTQYQIESAVDATTYCYSVRR